LEGYLVVAVKYRILNLFASKERERKFRLYALDNLSELDYSSINNINYSDTKSWLVKLTNKLPAKCRLAYALRNEGLSYKEIAEHMKVSEKTVENHIGKALKSLRGGFGQYILLLILLLSKKYF
jgi:RNA polymerase sigma-70 factor (ECF subfamily)